MESKQLESSQMQLQMQMQSSDPDPPVLELDGNYLEGGGQILRNGVALAALLQRSVHVHSIRKDRRPAPGLRPQHMAGLLLICRLAGGQLSSMQPGDTQVTYRAQGTDQREEDSGDVATELPASSNPENNSPPAVLCYEMDTGTAGSVCLLLQSALPVLLFHRTAANGQLMRLRLMGGTNANMAPPVDFAQQVLWPILRRMMPDDALRDAMRISLLRRGYYPRGGGLLEVEMMPIPTGRTLVPVQLLRRGRIQRVTGLVYLSRLSSDIGQRMKAAALQVLRRTMRGVPVALKVVEEPQHSGGGAGCGLILVAETTEHCLLVNPRRAEARGWYTCRWSWSLTRL
jgi:RNA 3'-terminal phosphate cyclase (ATP)